jgi:hypothetical protein
MKNLCFLFLIMVPLSGIGQQSVKIYAYSQVVTPGTIPKGVTGENGNRVNTKKESAVNYYIFATHSASVKISFGEIWVNGKFYSVQTHKVDSTPVININKTIPANPEKEILVPFTRQQVVSIVPGKTMNNVISQGAWFRNMAKKNELIVSYMYRGKKYFIAVKKIKMLKPVAGV